MDVNIIMEFVKDTEKERIIRDRDEYPGDMKS